MAFNSSSRYLLTGGNSKTLNIWDMKTKSVKKTYKVSHNMKRNLNCFVRNDSFFNRLL